MDVVLLTLTVLSLGAAAGFGFLSWRVGREDRERSAARVEALGNAMEPVSHGERIAVGSVFEPGEGLSSRPMIRAIVGGVMALAIVIVAIVGMYGSRTTAASTKGIGSNPLELISMRHQREGTTLTVSGLVRNPGTGAPVNGLTAVVFVFDHGGGFVASGRSPVEFSTLVPGEETPFTVAVSNVSDVARYRISFRTGQGLVRHVDRRSAQSQLALAGR
jgi:hypothetical protein